MTDFIIENGILEKYIGNGEEVIVPESVTSIGPEYSFMPARPSTDG